MIKIIPLIKATLKSFVRNKTSILLLIVAPLLLIAVIFLSFNPDGLRKIPVGVIDESSSLDLFAYENSYLSYLSLKPFQDLDLCLLELRQYKRYVCIHLIERDKIILNIYYDNTKEPVIWEILERIKGTVDRLQKEQSKKSMTTMVDGFKTTNAKLAQYQKDIQNIQKEIDVYIREIDATQRDLTQARSQLSSTINQMDSDIYQINLAKNNILSTKNNFQLSILNQLNYIDQVSNNTRMYTSNSRSIISSFENQLNSQLYTFDQRIRTYEYASSDGKNQISNMNTGIIKINNVKSKLNIYKQDVFRTSNDLNTIKTDLDKVITLDLDGVISPVIMEAQPAYVPEVATKYVANYENENAEAPPVEEIIKGINMISLQTIFPTVLFLILLFLSLLISSFVCLSEINSSAHTRISLIRKIFFSEFISTFLSSLIIVIIPLMLILVAGDLLFQINILNHFLTVLVIIGLTSTFFILIGMMMAYLIRKESITLLLTTFLLVLFIFLSGIILPLERMSAFSNILAESFPTYLGVSMFNRAVFYNQAITPEYLIQMTLWLVVFLLCTLLVKRLKENKSQKPFF